MDIRIRRDSKIRFKWVSNEVHVYKRSDIGTLRPIPYNYIYAEISQDNDLYFKNTIYNTHMGSPKH